MNKKDNTSEEDIEKLLKAFDELNTNNVWSKVKRDDFTVKRFALGFVNDIVCCEMTDDARHRLCTRPSDCPGIVVKFIAKELFLKTSPIETAICAAILSERKLCPKLLFVNDDCYIHEYVKSRNYNYDDDCDEDTVRQLARILAQFHSIEPPVSCNGFVAWKKTFSNMESLVGVDVLIKKEHLKLLENNLELKEKYYSIISEIDLSKIFNYNNKLIEEANSPLVFSHNDFNRGNRIVKCDQNGKNKQILLLDFDYSNYNYRGLDLGRYFSNYRHKDDMFGNEGFPTDKEMELFLNEYRNECCRIQGDHYLQDENNSLAKLINESKVFTMNAYAVDFLFGLFMYTTNPKDSKAEYFLNMIKNRFSGYKTLQKQFENDGVISSMEKLKIQ